jgi:hypothetical protein
VCSTELLCQLTNPEFQWIDPAKDVSAVQSLDIRPSAVAIWKETGRDMQEYGLDVSLGIITMAGWAA